MEPLLTPATHDNVFATLMKCWLFLKGWNLVCVGYVTPHPGESSITFWTKTMDTMLFIFEFSFLNMNLILSY